jgi:hypothetical protein
MGKLSMTFKYFAYGSNMLLERLRRRCGSAQAIGVGTLNGYTLEFSKPSMDESGKATIVKSDVAGARVVGVLYDIATEELRELDNAEGYGKGYDRAPAITPFSHRTTRTPRSARK